MVLDCREYSFSFACIEWFHRLRFMSMRTAWVSSRTEGEAMRLQSAAKLLAIVGAR